jgi:hypothetical protein
MQNTHTTIKNGQHLYDFIMSSIEPELTSSELPKLEKKYKDESREQKEERMERYKQAFIIYDKAFEASAAPMLEHARSFRQDAYKQAEVESKEEELEQLSILETQFNNLT